MRRRGAPARGFTLIEILVALAVLALSLGTVISAVSSQARNVVHLADRTLAQWVAANVVADARLAGEWPEPGTRRGHGEMGERRWAWRSVTLATDDPDLRRIEVSVAAGDGTDGPLVTLVAYLGRPMREAR